MTDTGGADYRLPSTVLISNIDGEMVLLNMESEQYFGLDPVGANIVTRLTSEPMDAALRSLLGDYDVEAADLGRDVQKLLAELMAAGLIEPVTQSG